jgi:hypothetical protein
MQWTEPAGTLLVVPVPARRRRPLIGIPLACLMSFNFSGIFAKANADPHALLQTFRARFGGIGRSIESPFLGFGVSHVGRALSLFPNDPECGPDPKAEALAKELVDFSATCPDATFVFLYAECFGGVCEYAGFAFRGGQRIHEEPFQDEAGDVGPLKRLVSYLGIELGDPGFFEPLSRDFFSHETPYRGMAGRGLKKVPFVPSERVCELSAKLANAWAPAIDPPPKRSLWRRLFGGGEAG